MVRPSSNRRLWRALVALGVILLAVSAYALAGLGRFLAREDPLEKADAIVALAGSRMLRPLEAADLHREGWAPYIVLSYGPIDPGLIALRERGIVLAPDEDQARDILVRAGTPANAFILLPRVHDNTAQEAETLRSLVETRGWRRVIVVSSKYHLRRAGFAFRRQLEGTGAQVIMHGSRYDDVNPDRWWASREDLRWILSEGTKFIAYGFGLGG